MYRPDKRFHFVLTEAELRFRLCSPTALLGQLDRLISFSQLPNVRLGIIGFKAHYATSPWHGFWLYDSERVVVETFSAELDLRQPPEIQVYGTAFEQLAAVASYGRSARAIINAAGYAEWHGFEFAGLFHEFHYGSFRAWADLSAAVRLTGSRHVIIPSFNHVAHNLLLCVQVMQRLTDETEAQVHALTANRRAVQHHMDVPAW